MNESNAHADRFQSLHHWLREQFEIPESQKVDPVTQIVVGFLMWEASSQLADEALGSLRDQFVDFNEIRICQPAELAHALGRGYPRSRERAERLSAALNDIFRREDMLRLSRLEACTPSEIEEYVFSLAGMTPYVAGQLLLLSFNLPKLPVDSQLHCALAEEGAADSSLDLRQVQDWCTPLIAPNELADAHLLFQGWVEERTGR